MKKYKLSKLLSVALSAVMFIQMSCFAFAENVADTYEDRIISVETVTSYPTASYASIVDGKVALNSGNHVKYIDRVDVPDYAVELYNKLADVDFWLDEANFAEDGENHYEFNYGAAYEPDDFIAVHVATIPASENPNINDVSKYCRAAFDALDRDHPEIFWFNGQTRVSSVNYSNRSDYYFIITDLMTGFEMRRTKYTDVDTLAADISTFNNKVDSILSTATGTDYQKILAFNSYLTKNNSYNSIVSTGGSTPEDSLESFNAMMGNTGATGPVCEAYARAFKVLCDKASIPCVLVDGYATEDHMWNYVQLDEKWYAVDVTWNDPTVSGVTAANSGYESTNYLAVGSTTIINGKSFGSRTIENCASVNGTEFLNGPVLSTTKYDPNAVVYYTVTFDTAGHGTAPASQSVAKNGLVTKPADPEADGYIFKGWKNDGVEWNFETDKVTSSITLTADWEEIVYYTVTFDTADHGTAPVSQSVAKNGLVTKPADPQADGYIFKGWKNGGVEWDFENDKVTSSITLTADWEEIVYYTVTFDTAGRGTAPASQNVAENSLVTKPDGPIVSGYVITGWYNNGTEWNFDTDKVTENITLVAKWEEQTLQVGDVDGSGGKPKLKDVVLLYQYVSGWSVSIEESVADVDGSGGKPKLKDVVLLYQYVSGWSVTLG